MVATVTSVSPLFRVRIVAPQQSLHGIGDVPDRLFGRRVRGSEPRPAHRPTVRRGRRRATRTAAPTAPGPHREWHPRVERRGTWLGAGRRPRVRDLGAAGQIVCLRPEHHACVRRMVGGESRVGDEHVPQRGGRVSLARNGIAEAFEEHRVAIGDDRREERGPVREVVEGAPGVTPASCASCLRLTAATPRMETTVLNRASSRVPSRARRSTSRWTSFGSCSPASSPASRAWASHRLT